MWTESEKLLMGEKIILIDLDGTLIDEQYEINDDGIFEAIQIVQNKGYAVGLNSDTPFQALQEWADFFGTNDLLIVERGAAIFLPNKKRFVLSKKEDFFAEFNAKLISYFKNCSDCVLIFGDATKIVRDDNFRTSETGQFAIVFNTLRKWSTSFFIRASTNERRLIRNPNLEQNIFDKVNDKFSGKLACGRIDWNLHYGIFILNDPDVSKAKAAKALLQLKRVDQLIMIGDSTSDFLAGLPVIHYAPANADKYFKMQCERVANAPFTKGVVEILETILQTGN